MENVAVCKNAPHPVWAGVLDGTKKPPSDEGGGQVTIRSATPKGHRRELSAARLTEGLFYSSINIFADSMEIFADAVVGNTNKLKSFIYENSSDRIPVGTVTVL